jgi:Skp family chaperone for outer membrane proteins
MVGEKFMLRLCYTSLNKLCAIRYLRLEPSENYSSVIAANPDSIFSELQALRKKYDAVVEYTVHLTAERDAIVSQLESAQRELNREKTKKKSDGSSVMSGKDKSSDKKGTEKVSRL